MRTLSFPTIGLLFEIASDLFDPITELAPLMMRCDLFHGRGGEQLQHVLLNDLMKARVDAEAGSQQAHRSLLRFAELVVEKRACHPRRIRPHVMDELRQALLADGYQLSWEPASQLPGEDSAVCAIRPTDAAPVPLAGESTALEAELAARGYASVLNHYLQAVDGFTHHKYESANGDLRSALEDLVTRLAEDHAGYRRHPRANQGGAAIMHLIGHGLPDDAGGQFLQGLWRLSHTNGAHPGQSDADEARFRMVVVTATARFLLRHFAPTSP